MFFANLIEAIIQSLGAAAITESVIWIMLAFFVVSLVLKFAGRAGRLVQYTPTLLTSIGILGTFCGVVAGLFEFNTDSIDTSISPLLEGMKTAFLTSLVGMLLSIVFKVILTLTGRRSRVSEQIGIRDLYEATEEQNEILSRLTSSICGRGEDSLINQIQEIRNDQNANHRSHMENMRSQQQMFESFQLSLRQQLKDFSEILSTSATDAVIQALEEVIKKFNKDMTEQFGDNFKELNSAVRSLVTWQEQYRLQLVDMQKKYAIGVTAIQVTEQALTSIKESTDAIPDSMRDLKKIIEAINFQKDDLNRHLEAFKAMRDGAVAALPEIDKRIKLTLTGISDGSDLLVSGIAESTKKLN